jgi:hypothetical protein
MVGFALLQLARASSSFLGIGQSVRGQCMPGYHRHVLPAIDLVGDRRHRNQPAQVHPPRESTGAVAEGIEISFTSPLMQTNPSPASRPCVVMAPYLVFLLPPHAGLSISGHLVDRLGISPRM